MVYRKNYRAKSKRNFKKKRYGKKKSYIKKTIKRALQARGLSKPEWKHARTESVLSAVNTDFDAQGITVVPAVNGETGYEDFIGKKICAKSFTIKGMFYNGTDLMKCVRIMIVEDLQGMDSSNLVPYSALSTRGYQILYTSNIHSLYNDIYPRRWKMLWDQTFLLGGLSAVNAGPENNRHHFYKKIMLGNAQVSFAQAAGVLPSLYPVNRNYLIFIIGETEGMLQTYFTDFAYTDV